MGVRWDSRVAQLKEVFFTESYSCLAPWSYLWYTDAAGLAFDQKKNYWDLKIFKGYWNRVQLNVVRGITNLLKPRLKVCSFIEITFTSAQNNNR